MTCGKTSLVDKLVTMTFLLCCFSSAIAEELYQWKDKDGTITYSTTPPSANITTNYLELSTKPALPSINLATPENVAEKPVVSEQRSQQIGKRAVKKESQLERLVRLAPEPKENIILENREIILQPVNQDKVRKQRKCRDLNNRVTALETRLYNISSADELNNSMLLLTKYQNSFNRHCNQ